MNANDPIYEVISNLIKEVSANAGATLDILVEKGLIEEEDIKVWCNMKARHIARLDQLQSKVQEEVNIQHQEKLKEAIVKNNSKEPKQSTNFIESIWNLIFRSY